MRLLNADSLFIYVEVLFSSPLRLFPPKVAPSSVSCPEPDLASV